MPHGYNIRRICVTYVSSVTFVICANFDHRMRQFCMSYASIMCVICVTCVTHIRHVHEMCATRASIMCFICITYVMCQLCHLSQLNVVYVTGDMCVTFQLCASCFYFKLYQCWYVGTRDACVNYFCHMRHMRQVCQLKASYGLRASSM